MNWLITGGCGFIGSSFINYIKENHPSEKIRIVDNLSVGQPSSIFGEVVELNGDSGYGQWSKDVVQLVNADIRSQQEMIECVDGADIIVHLAANTGVAPSVENPLFDCESNVLGTLHMLEAARHNNVKRFVFASSGAPVGEIEPPIHEEVVPHPVSPYGASKLAGEAYCSSYHKTFDIDTVCLRFGNVYGPGSGHKSSVVAKFFNKIIKEQDVEIYGTGEQTRDFIYIEDLVNAILSAAKAESVGGEVFQIATSSETSVNEIVDLISDVVLENGLSMTNISNTEPRKGDVMRNYSDTSKAKKILGWQANMKLKDGLGRTLKYFLDN